MFVLSATHPSGAVHCVAPYPTVEAAAPTRRLHEGQGLHVEVVSLEDYQTAQAARRPARATQEPLGASLAPPRAAREELDPTAPDASTLEVPLTPRIG